MATADIPTMMRMTKPIWAYSWAFVILSSVGLLLAPPDRVRLESLWGAALLDIKDVLIVFLWKIGISLVLNKLIFFTIAS